MLSAREIETMASCMSRNWLTRCYDVVEPDDEKQGYYSPSIVGKLPLPVPTRPCSYNDGYTLIIPNLEESQELTHVLDKRNIFTTRREYENPNFVSDDPQENADINSREWDIMRNLSTDGDRRRRAMDAFGNSEPADPTKNLSYFGFLRKRGSTRRESDSIFPTNLPVRLENGRLTLEASQSNRLVPGGSRKRKAFGDDPSERPRKRRKMLPISEFRETLEKIVIGHKRKTLRPRDLKYFVRHWRLNVDETTAFYKYYDDTDLVPFGELNKNDSIEDLYVQFSTFYGMQEAGKCKDCSLEDRRDVVHFM